MQLNTNPLTVPFASAYLITQAVSSQHIEFLTRLARLDGDAHEGKSLMNKECLAKNVGKKLRILPPPIFVDPIHGHEYDSDLLWILRSVKNGVATLYQGGLSYTLPLGLDHIHDYLSDSGRSDGFLRLRSQVIMRGNECFVEPLP